MLRDGRVSCAVILGCMRMVYVGGVGARQRILGRGYLSFPVVSYLLGRGRVHPVGLGLGVFNSAWMTLRCAAWLAYTVWQ